MPPQRGPARVLRYGDFAPEALLAEIEQRGWFVVSDVPCWVGNTELLDLAASFGKIRGLGPNINDPVREGEAVHLINALAEPMPDASGKMMLSTMPVAHHMHTDETFCQVPSRYVLLHCWRPDPRGGGDSLVAMIDDIVTYLDPAVAAGCYATPFHWREAVSPILSRMDGAAWPFVRFNLREVLTSERGEGEPGTATHALAHAFAEATERATVALELRAGDCLILDNWRVLHGRTQFDAGSPRLLKRVGVD